MEQNYKLVNEGGGRQRSLSTENSVSVGNLSCRPCVWKLVLVAVFLNAVISTVLLTVIIVFLTHSTGSAAGLVPGTIYPSLIKAMQANTDPKAWKDIFDSGAKVFNTVKSVDWSINEEIKYNSGEPPATCYEQTDQDDCENFVPDCDYEPSVCPDTRPLALWFGSGAHNSTPDNACTRAGGICDDNGYCCKSCQWVDGKCTGAATMGGSGEAQCIISEEDSESADRTITNIYNSLTKASKGMGTPTGHNVASPLDVTKFVLDILNADYKTLSAQCKSIATKCVGIDFASVFQRPKDAEPSPSQFNAQIHVVCKAYADLCGKVNTAFS